MTTNQKVWAISSIIILLCFILAGVLYLYTGQIFLAIFIAPPIIHYILKKRMVEERNGPHF